jgi:hypothetical protein
LIFGALDCIYQEYNIHQAQNRRAGKYGPLAEVTQYYIITMAMASDGKFFKKSQAV